MRLDRWFKSHFPGLSFGHLQKLLRSGQVRIDGGRAKSDTRIEPGQMIRVPPLGVDKKGEGPVTTRTMRGQGDAEVLSQMLHLRRPQGLSCSTSRPGLPCRAAPGITRHLDDMLEAWRNAKGEKPRLVHRLDRDTSGVLVVARTRLAAMKLAEAFRGRDAKKTYWALVRGVPKKREDKISTWLVKEQTPDGDRVRVAKHGEEGADHAVSHYRVVEQAAQTLSWLEMEPLYRPHPPAARPRRPYRLPDHRRSQIFRGRPELGLSRRHAEPAASACPPHRHPASRPRRDRRHRAAAAAYGAELEPARLRPCQRRGRANERGRRHVRPARRDRHGGRRVHAGADLLMGAERRCRQARQCRLQPDLPDAGALGDRRLPGVPVVPLSRHQPVRRRRNAAAPACLPASCSVASSP